MAATDRRQYLTLRARLTLSYVGMVTGCAAVILAAAYLYIRYIPQYSVALEAPGNLVDAEQTPGWQAARGGRAMPLGEPGAAVEIRTAEDFFDLLLIVGVGALLLFALLGGVVGWIVSRRIIRPLTLMNAAAHRAASGVLDHRIHLAGPRDELSDLADTFNRMLASLEQSFATHRRFAANASHELRTPLATTKTMIDVALGDPDADAAELRRLARRVAEVNRASIETVDALLDLADAESGPPVRGPVDLADLVLEIAGDVAPEAAAADVTVDVVAPPCVALGEPVLLRQAVTNLLRNAVRHNVPGGTASVELTSGSGRACVTVGNTGPVVPPESVDSLAEPFVRGAGRTRGPGHGLGLAVVTAVARAHQGTLALHARPGGGLTAHLDLPAVPGPAGRNA